MLTAALDGASATKGDSNDETEGVTLALEVVSVQGTANQRSTQNRPLRHNIHQQTPDTLPQQVNSSSQSCSLYSGYRYHHLGCSQRIQDCHKHPEVPQVQYRMLWPSHMCGPSFGHQYQELCTKHQGRRLSRNNRRPPSCQQGGPWSIRRRHRSG